MPSPGRAQQKSCKPADGRSVGGRIGSPREAAIDRFKRNALLLWSGQFASQMGDSVFGGAVPWLAASLAGSGYTGLVVFLGAAPFLAIGPFAGAWVDRGDRRRIMIGSDLARAALLIALPVLGRTMGITYTLVALTALLLSCASTPFLPARDALLPRLAEGRPLVRYNAAFQTSGQLAQILGLWLGGMILGTDPNDVGRIVDGIGLVALTFLASAVTLAFIGVPAGQGHLAGSGGGATETRPTTNVWRDAVDGMKFAGRDPLLIGLLVLTALDNLAIMGPAIVGATLFVKYDLRLGPNSYMWLEGVMALGFLAGALVIARFGVRWRKGRMILFGMLLDGLTYVPFFWVSSYPLALALIFVHGLFIPWIVVGRTSLLQHHVAEGRAGKVFSLVHMTVAGMTALSALAAGAIADFGGARLLFLVAGVFGALCGLAGWLFMPRLRSAT